MKANESEMQLQSFLDHVSEVYTTLSLRPQGDNTMIEKTAINLCEVSCHGKTYCFGGISEPFYDKMVHQYDWRIDEVRVTKLFNQ